MGEKEESRMKPSFILELLAFIELTGVEEEKDWGGREVCFRHTSGDVK